MTRMWHPDASVRPTASQVLMKWFIFCICLFLTFYFFNNYYCCLQTSLINYQSAQEITEFQDSLYDIVMEAKSKGSVIGPSGKEKPKETPTPAPAPAPIENVC